SRLLVEGPRLRLQHSLVIEVLAGRDALAVDLAEAGGEAGRIAPERGEGCSEVPVAGGDKGETFTFTVDDEPGRGRLHAAGRQAGPDLAPEHRRDLIAVEAVEDATGLLGVDERGIEVARVLLRTLDGVL